MEPMYRVANRIISGKYRQQRIVGEGVPTTEDCWWKTPTEGKGEDVQKAVVPQASLWGEYRTSGEFSARGLCGQALRSEF